MGILNGNPLSGLIVSRLATAIRSTSKQLNHHCDGFHQPRPAGCRSTGSVAMGVGHTKALDGLAFEIEFDHHCGFVARDQTVMARVNRNDLRSSEVHSTTVGVTDLNLAACEEPHMCVHAQIGADNRFHVRGPAKSGRVDHTLHTTRARRDDLDCDTSNFAALRVFYRRKQWISPAHHVLQRNQSFTLRHYCSYCDPN